MAEEPDGPNTSVFFLMADLIRFMAVITLPSKIIYTDSCSGISGITQLMYALIFTIRTAILCKYMSFNSIDLQTILWLGFTGITYLTVGLIFYFKKETYEHKNDFFRIDLLIIPCIAFTIPYPYCPVQPITFYEFSLEVFSIYLEAVALIPQTFFKTTEDRIHGSMAAYMGFSSLSAIFYTVHTFSLSSQSERILFASNVIQLLFCCDYFLRNILLFRSIGIFKFKGPETNDNTSTKDLANDSIETCNL